MQILHFCPLPLFSGLEQYALDLAVRQRRRGLKAEMVVLRDSELQKETAKVDLPIHVVDFSSRKALVSSARQYRDLIRQHQDIKVIHLHTSRDIERIFLAFSIGAWPFHLPRPKIIQQNHIWISHSKKDPIHWLTHRAVDEIWCSSQPARKDLVRFLPVPAEKIKIIRYGRDLNLREQFLDREQARRELDISQDALVLGAIARIDQAKGIWELLHGTIQVMKEKSDLHLVIIGGPTLSDPKSIEFAQKVERAIAELALPIRSRIHLKGAIPKAAKFLKAFDLYAQVSYKETFSLALLDALLAERPVLGTKSGGTPEVVIENQTGWLCEPENAESLGTALVRALNGRNHWPSFAATGRARVESEFDIETVLDEIISRYNLS